MPPVAQMRASHMQSNIDMLAELDAKDRDAIYARCGADIERVSHALPITWLPLASNTDLIDCVYEVVGDEGACAWVHASMRCSMERTLLRPIVDGLRRIGLGPHHGLKRCEAAWHIMYKDAGTLTCELAETGRATLKLHDAPTEMMRGSYLSALLDAFEGVAVELGGRQVSKKMTPSATGALFEFTWR